MKFLIIDAFYIIIRNDKLYICICRVIYAEDSRVARPCLLKRMNYFALEMDRVSAISIIDKESITI